MPRVELTAGTVEYDEAGSGPVVVLLHGVLMDQTQWDAAFAHLPTRLPLRAPAAAARRPPGPDAPRRRPEPRRAGPAGRGAARGARPARRHPGGTPTGAARCSSPRAVSTNASAASSCCRARPSRTSRRACPGKMAALATRLPGGISLAARQIRVPWLRRTPLLFGQMAKRPIADDVARSWTEGVLTSAGVRRDLRSYGRTRFDRGAPGRRHRGAGRLRRARRWCCGRRRTR